MTAAMLTMVEGKHAAWHPSRENTLEETYAVPQVGGDDTTPQGTDLPPSGRFQQGVREGDEEIEPHNRDIGCRQPRREKGQRGSDQEAKDKKRGQEIRKSAGIEADTSCEIAAMQCVTSNLTKVGAVNRTAMMPYDDARVIPQCLACALEIGAQKRVFAGPKVLSETADGIECGFSHKEIATWEIFNLAQGALDEITVAEVSGDQRRCQD